MDERQKSNTTSSSYNNENSTGRMIKNMTDGTKNLLKNSAKVIGNSLQIPLSSTNDKLPPSSSSKINNPETEKQKSPIKKPPSIQITFPTDPETAITTSSIDETSSLEPADSVDGSDGREVGDEEDTDDDDDDDDAFLTGDVLERYQRLVTRIENLKGKKGVDFCDGEILRIEEAVLEIEKRKVEIEEFGKGLEESWKGVEEKVDALWDENSKIAYRLKVLEDRFSEAGSGVVLLVERIAKIKEKMKAL